MSASSCISEFDLNLIKLRKPLEFPDNTIQSTAYQGLGVVPTLDEVLSEGNDAFGQDITGVNDFTLSGIAQYNDANSVIPSIPALTSTIFPSFELTSFYLSEPQGGSNDFTGSITLNNNLTGTTNYIVLPSVYFGYTGDLDGLNNAINSSGEMYPIVISNITPTQFTWNFKRNGTLGFRIYLLFLVVYQATGTNYSKIYS